jgi:hypothetical protein
MDFMPCRLQGRADQFGMGSIVLERKDLPPGYGTMGSGGSGVRWFCHNRWSGCGHKLNTA